MSEEFEKPVKRRFIAGAVCPRCSEMDKIVNYKLGDKNYRECVACGFKDEIRLHASPRELDTRVNQTADREVEETAVKILLPSSGTGNKK
ncbi:YheV family putative zinc ribbon protein [Microbulbifer pacificus]|uniref:YheV family putative zinc ribbon protein n=1 Tax=Microbulbifer pacificus TaxID=407164 RepID=A0AAU0MTX6_9GAMM|nr:YheV family putative zinc ribbon protein [Microbulbifer pacificus]WOX03939.1 YheV family putative zinc ribbon protein [Microbulbifer pacificus]